MRLSAGLSSTETGPIPNDESKGIFYPNFQKKNAQSDHVYLVQ